MSVLTKSLIIAFAILGLLFQCIFIYSENKKKYTLAVILKGCASLSFLSVGIVSFLSSNNKEFAVLILIGLVLGVIGDILLNLRFVFTKIGNVIFLSGTASFLCGHILYIVALFKISKIKYIYAPILVAILIVGIIGYFIFKVLKVKNGMKIFGCIYVLIVSMFMCIATYNLINSTNALTISSAIGSMLFFASDVILIFNSFGKHPRFALRASNLLLYYIGQVLIAIAMLF